MTVDFYVRAGRNDHTIVDRFLTPSSATLFETNRQPIGTVVADATVASARPQLARLTSDAGVPFVIDPLTPLLQSEQAESDPWARLPFAQPEPLAVADLGEYLMDELIDRTFTFQREHGATELIPPYFYSNKRLDPWWGANLAILRRSADYLGRENIDLPVLPVLAVNLREYGPSTTWEKGIDAFISATRDLNAEHVALSWSWNGASHTNDSGLSLLLNATEHASTSTPVIGWRAGTYGLAMAAAGASGYETGIGSRENLHYVQLAASKRPRPQRGQTPHGTAYVYLSEFGRSVPRSAGRLLLGHAAIAGSLVCNPENYCCLGGTDSMINEWRQHTVRERRRELDQLASMPPNTSWRLHHIEQKAERSHTLAVSANEVLEQAGARERIPHETFASLQRVAAEMQAQRRRSAA